MVKFTLTMGGFDIFVDEKFFGRLQKNDGFFTDPTVTKEYLVVSSKDLITIALKAEEAKNYGNVIPICAVCKGTPKFPNEIYNPNEGMMYCQTPIHYSL
ncbi:MAG: hypothetical protein HYW88_00945 [Candidatus Sungbacteria bacterium]|nr:hypothetical protein [Candidatus Sungbacteria bacterium]